VEKKEYGKMKGKEKEGEKRKWDDGGRGTL